jgi:hypothetical protein
MPAVTTSLSYAFACCLQGCRAISPVWMSYYIDGCGQDLHCDSFHGPFAYVLSLTPWEGRDFTGAWLLIH